MKQNHNEVKIPTVTELNIYEGGSLNQISATDLMNNEIAIKQLINTYNVKVKDIKDANNEISTLKSELEFHKTAPFVSIFAIIVNLGGSTISAIAVNQMTSEKPVEYAFLLLVIGFVLVFFGSIATILYPFALKVFNKKEPISK